ncbi:MAG: SURF1 family protein [Chloroflexota bacterium]
MSIVSRMFSRRWFIATLLVAVGVAALTRLGIWQLDRLDQRRAFNARVQAQIDAPLLVLTGEALSADLFDMEYRQVQATGEYDFSNQIALRNQYWENQWGVHLITPLIISGSQQAILVDRGWIPAEDFESGDWSKFDEPGQITVNGVLRRPQVKAELGGRSDPTPAPGSAPLKAWNFVNIEQIARQIPYTLLPAYLQQAPDSTWSAMPYRTQPELELTEGPHLSYAMQWFAFATILGLGYPFFIRRQERKPPTKKSDS